MIECFSHSTAHGLAHIGNEPTLFGKVLWFLLTLTTISIFSFHTFTLSTQLLEYQMFISTQPNAVPFQQPDIVFCSERIFARDFISNPPENDYEFMSNVSKSIQEFDRRYRDFKHKSGKLIWDSLSIHQLYKAFFHRKHELFLNVTCNFDKVDISNLEIEFSFNHLACYRLKSDVCRLNSPFNSIVVKFYIHLYATNNTYNSSLDTNINNRSLDSYLFIQKEYLDEVADGVHIYFVQPNEAIHGHSRKVTASANTQTDIRIKSTQYVKQSSIQTRCQETVVYEQFYNLLEENITQNLLNYTEHSICIYRQIQYIFYKMFKCVSKQLPIPINIAPNVSFCGNIFTQKEYATILYSTMTTGKLFNQKDILGKCSGAVPCNTVKYKASVNYNTWPWRKTLIRMLTGVIPRKLAREAKNFSSPGLTEAMEDYKSNPENLFAWTKNFIKVRIASDEFMSTLVTESPSYSLTNFFSDVGGIMGFYMGASLLTLSELFRVLYFAICSLIPTEEKVGEEDVEENKEDTV